MLGSDSTTSALRYERIRQKLIKYFAWERIPEPEDCADETINRVAKRISEGEAVESPESYFYGVARMVLRESLTEQKRRERITGEFSRTAAIASFAETADPAALACLAKCLDAMPAEQRTFLLQYYRGDHRERIERRRQLAEQLHLPLNAVRNRALRLRLKMEDCVRKCLLARGRT